jgi:predicted glycogen debranching enzyme
MIEPILTFPWQPDGDPSFLRTREWLVTNGLGGYASGTLLNIGTRRFHGWFIPNLPAPYGRTIMIPRLDDAVHCDHDTVQLGGVEFADGRSEGDVARVLTEFRYEWQTPVWVFRFHGRTIEKRVTMPHGHNTVYVAYTLLDGDAAQLHLRPYLTFRQHGAPLDEGDTPRAFPVTFLGGRYEILFGAGLPTLRLCLRPQSGVFVAQDKREHDVLYRMERDRGYDCTTNLFSPGYFTVELTAGTQVSLVASIEPWETLEYEAARIFAAERHRVEKMLALAPERAQTGTAAQLVLAADQFIMRPGTRPEEQVLAHSAGEEVYTIVAGYHWFTDWGRDTMISLEGLTLCTGRHHEGKAILQTFAHYVKDGLLPNHFPEGERAALYNTVDATLWYFHALDRYLAYTGDHDTLRLLYPTLRSIIDHHTQGTHFGIGMDPEDGLIAATAEGFALTWMDAKVGDWVVTPRRGKPVEIQALWYNALCLMATWAQELGESPEPFNALAQRAQASFNQRFWFADGQHLFDVIDGEHGNDASLRPNQIFAISLRWPILHSQYWQPVLNVVTEKLLTPVGLRTLVPGHKDYRSHYDGDLRSRDAAYHQGTVWPWLIGHFIDAWRRLTPDTEPIRTFVAGLADSLRVAGVGTLSEICDAEAPYVARGCIAQAWSVAEMLRSVLAIAEAKPSKAT